MQCAQGSSELSPLTEKARHPIHLLSIVEVFILSFHKVWSTFPSDPGVVDDISNLLAHYICLKTRC